MVSELRAAQQNTHLLIRRAAHLATCLWHVYLRGDLRPTKDKLEILLILAGTEKPLEITTAAGGIGWGEECLGFCTAAAALAFQNKRLDTAGKMQWTHPKLPLLQKSRIFVLETGGR